MIKKSLIIFAAVIFAFAMMGCPNDVPEPTEVTVTAADDATTVERGDTLQFSAVVEPAGAPQAVTWSIYPAVDGATITTGLLTIANTVVAGTEVTVRATATGTTVYGEATVTVVVTPTEVTVTAAGNATTVERRGTLQFSAAVGPDGAPPAVTWAINPAVPGAGISTTGLLSVTAFVAVDTPITVRAAATTAIYGYLTVTAVAGTCPSDSLVGDAREAFDRNDFADIVLGEDGMAALIAADHFGAVGNAQFDTANGFVFVYDILNNASGMQVLPPDAFPMDPGYRYTIIARGRTSAQSPIGSSRLEVQNIDGDGGTGLGNTAVTASPWAIPALIDLELILTEANVAAGLRIAPNGWGTGSFGEVFADLVFSIEDLIIYREAIIIGDQEVFFNLAENAAFQAFEDGQQFNLTGAWNAPIVQGQLHSENAAVTIGVHEGRRFMLVGNRAQNFHGINVTGLPPGLHTVRVTGRLSGSGWSTGNIQLTDNGTGTYAVADALANDGRFTLVGTASIAGPPHPGNTFRIQSGNTLPFYIYSIIVGTDLDQDAENPADTVDVEATENFWPPATP